MASKQQEIAQQVKLHSCCDGCGVGKVKCDRKHSKCGRCVTHGTTCIYGASRKIGKPSRERVRSCGDDDDVRNSTAFRSSLKAANSIASCSWDAIDDLLNPMDDFWDPMRGNSQDKGIQNSNHNQNKNGEMSEDNRNNISTLFDLDSFLSESYSNLPEPSMPNFSSVSIDGWKDKEQYSMLSSTPVEETAKTNLACESKMGSQPGWPQPEAEASLLSSAKGHDCHREAHDLLRRSSTATGSGIDLMAWDYLLLLNCEASEQFYCLPGCSCAESLYLMMLYAALSSATLTPYQHAIDDVVCASSNPLSPQNTPDTSAVDDSAVWTVPSVPAKIVVGALSADDHRVQCALKIQLLASGVQRSTVL